MEDVRFSDRDERCRANSNVVSHNSQNTAAAELHDSDWEYYFCCPICLSVCLSVGLCDDRVACADYPNCSMSHIRLVSYVPDNIILLSEAVQTFCSATAAAARGRSQLLMDRKIKIFGHNTENYDVLACSDLSLYVFCVTSNYDVKSTSCKNGI